MLKLTTDKHEASRGLFATAELLVLYYYAAYVRHEPSVCRLSVTSVHGAR